MTELRLVADDLTGALDSAAAFASVLGPVRARWQPAEATGQGSLAFSTGTREHKREAAAAGARAAAPLLAPDNGRVSFFKVDSLLRGHAGVELTAILSAVPFRSVVIAPAIPFQGRRTRKGRQQRLEPGGWVNTGEDIVATLNAAGHFVALQSPGAAVPDGISLFDAGSDADLVAIVAAAQARDGVLYVGAAGLAAALGRYLGPSQPASLPPLPLLGLIGTDHPVMMAQLDALGADHLRIESDLDAAALDIVAGLRARRAVFVSCHLPGAGREAARAIIAERFAALCRRLPRPPALFVSGGETLAALCRDLGAEELDVVGEFEPGVPLSILRGGIWDGIAFLSKSGAFGSPDLLQRLALAMGRSSEATS